MLLAVSVFGQRVESYATFFAACSLPGDTSPSMALRSFAQGGEKKLLVVNTSDLSTSIVCADSARCEKGTLADMRIRFAGHAYVLALDSAERRSASIEDVCSSTATRSRKG